MPTFERPTTARPLNVERPPLRVLSDKGSVVFSGDEAAVKTYLNNLPTMKGYRVECAPTNSPSAKDWIGFVERRTARASGQPAPSAPAKDAEPLITSADDPRYNPHCPHCVSGVPHGHGRLWREMMLRRAGGSRA